VTDAPPPRTRRPAPSRGAAAVPLGPRGVAAAWDARYREAGYAFGTAPNDFLVAVADRLPPDGRVLSLGAGEGRNAVWLAARGHRVHAVDLSTVGLDKAERLAAARGVALTVERADVATFDFGRERWDAIVSIFCHLAPEVRGRVHAAVTEALRPGGVFVLEGYAASAAAATEPLAREPAERLLDLPTVRAELAGLYLPIARSVHRGVFEGRCHAGPRAVVQVLGRRRGPG